MNWMSKLLTTLLLYLAISPILAGAALAQPNLYTEFEFESGHWVGKPQYSSNGQFDSCMVSEHNDQDNRLIIRLDGNNSLTLGVFGKDWGKSAPLRIQASALVDHQVLFKGTGLLHSDDSLGVLLSGTKKSLAMLARGKLLVVYALSRSIVFDLSGSEKAVNYLIRCADTIRTSA